MGLTLQVLESLNPGITCPDLAAGQNYCVLGTVSSSGTAANCDQFYLVKTGDSCEKKIDAQFSISATFLPATTSVPITTTTPADGIHPEHVPTGIIDQCNKFDLIQSGDTCEAIAPKHNIPLSTFYAWNLAIGSSCADLDLSYYVCVDTVGYTVPTTTTSAGNGITTPTPYEPGMVSDCTTFFFARSGDRCAGIAGSQGVTVGDIEG
ncbi:hypothetical protein AbraIFM66951_001307 [Aspergillus brasiliensis]|uniref:LysM domain-containing protein n=1 Tax=Aspergillus brasiliensis TaxID=319629 RepID=A0A9W5YXK0_9EURO|nr:hypothetical protein AbraCBS73388_011211 [Aspergillus brasiliensis]GKZ49054.1 hypothetical protein AbraIFM66951_001307 [Aspergillus brasiliensis]